MDRRWAFSLILLALIYASVEGVAWLGLWWTDGTPFSPSRLDVERAERLATPAARTPDADDGEGEAGPDWLKVEILHPYQGFVQNPERHTDPEKHPISEFGFVDRGPSLLSFHDLTEVFAGIEEPLYVDTCCHVNGRGNRLLGEAMARAILAESGAGS